jgi:hypothetical protein
MRISDVINTCDPLTITSSKSLQLSTPYNSLLAKNDDVQIRPNPFNSFFEVLINSDKDGKAQVIIYNSLGVKVKQQTEITLLKGANKISFNCSNFASGVYTLEVNFGNSKIVRKIVKA